jgi:hypothetical protein
LSGKCQNCAPCGMMLTSPCRLVGPSGSANLGGLFTSVWMFGHAGRGRQHADYVGNYMQGSGVGALARGAFPHMGRVRSPDPAGPHTTLSGGSRGQSGAVASKYPPAEPGALIDEPLEAAVGSLTRPAEEVSR